MLSTSTVVHTVCNNNDIAVWVPAKPFKDFKETSGFSPIYVELA